MALYIDFKILTPDAMTRLLKDSVKKQSIMSLPLHRRRKADALVEDEEEAAEPDPHTDAADEDREHRADLVEETRPGNAPLVTSEDFKRGTMPDRLPKSAYKRKAKKKGL